MFLATVYGCDLASATAAGSTLFSAFLPAAPGLRMSLLLPRVIFLLLKVQ